MAKKKIGDIASAHDLNPKEVVKQLQEAGFSVQSATSTIEERLALKVLNTGGNGAQQAQPAEQPQEEKPRRVQPAGSQPRPQARPRPEQQQRPQGGGQRGGGGQGQRGGGPQGGGQRGGPQGQRGGGPPGQRSGPPREGQGPRRPAQSGAGAGSGGGGGGGARHARPTRDDQRTGERAPNAGGGPRRVVIDSQASRRQGPGGGPGGPGGGPPRRPPRRGGRRRRGTYDEEKEFRPLDVDAQKATDLIRVNSGSTVKDVAEYLGVPIPEIIKKLMTLGEMATLTQTLSDDAIQVIADEFDKKIEVVHAADDVDAEPEFEDTDEDLESRPPVVTIMGHVDHGKTSLLDAIRQTSVAAGEAGGITQHIGAYQASNDGYTITFLDTPGHEAFTAMRARGSRTADIAVIVVAADDGVKPQTEEAIDHAKAAGVPMLVAVNKIDKEGADPVRTRTEMAQRGLNPSEWGGDTEFVDVSAKTKQGLDDLLETIQVVADLQELKANPEAEASGVVIESKLDPGRGPVVTVIIQRGTLHVGDALVAGSHWGRVRAMSDFKSERVKEAKPGDPVEVLGFDGVPEAGEFVHVVENDRRARQLATERAQRLKTEALARRSGRKVSLEDVFKRAKEGELKELALVIKGDVAGSVEALEDEIAKLPQSEVTVNVIHRGVGGVNESDVMLAAASDAVVIGFNVRPVGDAAAIADREGVEIRSYSVIYRVIDELRAAMQGLLEPEEVEETVGSIEVRQIFRASRIGVIAGSYVTDGNVRRGAKVRLVRDGTVVYTGEIETLRRFNDDVREVAAGFECGVTLRNFQDIKEGDVMEVFQTRQVERELA
jgi:translation initiation factor IF-2